MGWPLKTRKRLDIPGYDSIPAANPVYTIIEYRDFCAAFLEDGFVTAEGAKHKGKILQRIVTTISENRKGEKRTKLSNS